LVCSMILLCTAPVFAVEESTDSYELSELFCDYKEYSLSEMVEYISRDPQSSLFTGLFCGCSLGLFNPTFHIHRSGTNIGRIPNVLEVGFSEQSPKYLTSTSRVTTASNANYDFLIGDVGDKVMSVELAEGFVEYVNSLDGVERTTVILNFLMNVENNEEVAGVSWSNDCPYYGGGFIGTSHEEPIRGDCDGDGSLNSIDANLMRRILSGNDCKVNPFSVDMNADGKLNAVDSYALRLKLVG